MLYRSLTRSPGLVLSVVALLGLAIGLTSAVLQAVDVLLFKPPAHILEPEGLVELNRANRYGRFLEVRDRARTVRAAAYKEVTIPAAMPEAATEIQINAECVTAGYFVIIGTNLLLGTHFDNNPHAAFARTVVVSYRLWQQKFGGHEAAIGAQLRLGGDAYTVIGVARPDFRGVGVRPVDAWLPLEASAKLCDDSGSGLFGSDGGLQVSTIGRMTDAESLPAVQAEISTILPPPAFARDKPMSQVSRLFPRTQGALSRDLQTLLWMAGAVVAVFLTACANVAGLVSIRSFSRQRDWTIRMQLGASRRQLLADVLRESTAIWALSALASLIVMLFVHGLLVLLFPPVATDRLVNPRSLIFFVGCGGVAWALLTAAAMSHCLRVVARSSRRPELAVVRRGGREALVVAQIALTLLLTACTGLFVRSFDKVRDDVGYDLHHTLAVTLNLDRANAQTSEAIIHAFDTVAQRLGELSYVERIALSSGAVLGAGGTSRAFTVRVDPTKQPTPGTLSDHLLTAVTPGYFKTIGTRIMHGRAFTSQDDRESEHVVIIDEGLARELWGAESPIGKCAYLGSAVCLRVIGVAEARRFALISKRTREFFIPFDQRRSTEILPSVVFVRTKDEADRFAGAISDAVRSFSPTLRYATVQSIEALADIQTRSWMLGSTIFASFGAIGLLLSAIAMYATMMLAVQQRLREMAIRVALGAPPVHIYLLVMRRAVPLVAIGVALGLMALAAVSGVFRHVLFGIAPWDAPSIIAALAVLISCSVAACIRPSLRAARADPAAILRGE